MSHCEPAAPLALSSTAAFPNSEVHRRVAGDGLKTRSGDVRTTSSARPSEIDLAASVEGPSGPDVHRKSSNSKGWVSTHRTQSSDVPGTRMPIGFAVNTPPTHGSSQS